MLIVERDGVLTAYEFNVLLAFGSVMIGIALGTGITHIAFAPVSAWSDPWRGGPLTIMGVLALLIAERRTLIIDSNARTITLIKKRLFSTAQERVMFEEAVRFVHLTTRFGPRFSRSLHLVHTRGMLHVFGQQSSTIDCPAAHARRIASFAGLELEQRRP